MKRAWLAVLALLGGCSGQSGDIQLQIVAPAGPSPFMGLATVRLTVNHPGMPDVTTGPVSADGQISLDLKLTATGDSGDVMLEGLDAAGTVKVRGRVPPFNLIAASGTFSLWVAPVGVSSKLPFAAPPLLHHAAVALPFGVLFAGGSDANQLPVLTVTVYDQFFLGQLDPGESLPGPRMNLTGVGGDGLGGVYLFGGSNGQTQADLWRFDVTVPPSGLYTTIPLDGLDLSKVQRENARAVQLGELGVVVGGDVAGTPAAGALLVTMPSIAGTAPSAALIDVPARRQPAVVGGMAATGAIAVIAGGGMESTGPATSQVFLAPPNARFMDLDTPSLDGVTGLSGDLLADGRMFFTAGSDAAGPSANAWIYDPVAGSFSVRPFALGTPRSHATVTRVGAEILVAGGVNAAGEVLGDAEVLDASTLVHLRTIPLADPRADHTATLLPNDTVLLAGGRAGAADLPLASFEIYTPLKE